MWRIATEGGLMFDYDDPLDECDDPYEDWVDDDYSDLSRDRDGFYPNEFDYRWYNPEVQ